MEHLRPDDAAAQLREVQRHFMLFRRCRDRLPSEGIYLRELTALMKSTGFRSVRYRIEGGRARVVGGACENHDRRRNRPLIAPERRARSPEAQRDRRYIAGNERDRPQIALP